MISREDIEKNIDFDSYDFYGLLLINECIEAFISWQWRVSDDDIVKLLNILEANGETVGDMLISYAFEDFKGFCGETQYVHTIQEEFDLLCYNHHFYESWVDVCRKAVTWYIRSMFSDKKEAREYMAKKGYKNLSDFAKNEMEVYKTNDGYVEKTYL